MHQTDGRKQKGTRFVLEIPGRCEGGFQLSRASPEESEKPLLHWFDPHTPDQDTHARGEGEGEERGREGEERERGV